MIFNSINQHLSSTKSPTSYSMYTSPTNSNTNKISKLNQGIQKCTEQFIRKSRSSRSSVIARSTSGTSQVRMNKSRGRSRSKSREPERGQRGHIREHNAFLFDQPQSDYQRYQPQPQPLSQSQLQHQYRYLSTSSDNDINPSSSRPPQAYLEHIPYSIHRSNSYNQYIDQQQNTTAAMSRGGQRQRRDQRQRMYVRNENENRYYYKYPNQSQPSYQIRSSILPSTNSPLNVRQSEHDSRGYLYRQQQPYGQIQSITSPTLFQKTNTTKKSQYYPGSRISQNEPPQQQDFFLLEEKNQHIKKQQNPNSNSIKSPTKWNFNYDKNNDHNFNVNDRNSQHDHIHHQQQFQQMQFQYMQPTPLSAAGPKQSLEVELREKDNINNNLNRKESAQFILMQTGQKQSSFPSIQLNNNNDRNPDQFRSTDLILQMKAKMNPRQFQLFIDQFTQQQQQRNRKRAHKESQREKGYQRQIILQSKQSQPLQQQHDDEFYQWGNVEQVDDEGDFGEDCHHQQQHQQQQHQQHQQQHQQQQHKHQQNQKHQHQPQQNGQFHSIAKYSIANENPTAAVDSFQNSSSHFHNRNHRRSNRHQQKPVFKFDSQPERTNLIDPSNSAENKCQGQSSSSFTQRLKQNISSVIATTAALNHPKSPKSPLTPTLSTSTSHNNFVNSVKTKYKQLDPKGFMLGGLIILLGIIVFYMQVFL